MTVAAALRSRPDLHYARDYFDRRMKQLEPMYDAAVARGELSPTIDREVVKAMTAGAIYHRFFVAGRSADDQFIDEVVELACRSVGVEEPAKVSS
jgi:hypothetical protein